MNFNRSDRRCQSFSEWWAGASERLQPASGEREKVGEKGSKRATILF